MSPLSLLAETDAPASAVAVWGTAIAGLFGAIAAGIGLKKYLAGLEEKAEKRRADTYKDLYTARDEYAKRQEKRIDDLTKDIGELRKQWAVESKQQAEKIGRLESSVEYLTKRSSEQDQRIGELTAREAALLKENGECKALLVKSEAALDRATTELNAERAENAQLLQQNELLAGEVKRLKSECARMESEIVELRRRIDAMGKT